MYLLELLNSSEIPVPAKPIYKNSVSFLYTQNGQTEKEYKKIISFPIASKNIWE
jgi:hypothetical protein